MTETIFEWNAFLETEEGGRKPLYVQISGPEPAPEESIYYCLVHAPSIFSNDKRIFGIDREQATDLAINFVKSLLEDKQITDIDGQLCGFSLQ